MLLDSAEKNTTVLLKQFLNQYRKSFPLPFIETGLDFGHPAQKEDFELL